MKNLKFEYLYRDAGNYKNWGEVVFYNKSCMSVESIRQEIISKLIDKKFFVASALKIKDLHFAIADADLDHEWHEFNNCSLTNEPVNDEEKRDISEIIKTLESIKLSASL